MAFESSLPSTKETQPIRVEIEGNRYARFTAPRLKDSAQRCDLDFCGCRRTRFIWVSHKRKALFFDIPKTASQSVRHVLRVLGSHAYLEPTARAIARRQIRGKVDLEIHGQPSPLLAARDFAAGVLKGRPGRAWSAYSQLRNVSAPRLLEAVDKQKALLENGVHTIESPEFPP